jgi:carbon-monoxide dehydrogenase medium subunit
VKPAPFDYVPARSADEALEALARHGADAKVLAGGQSLLPLLNLRLARPAVVLDINRVAGLDAIEAPDGELRVGALVRLRALERWAAGRAPLLAEALGRVGHAAIRVRGTAVGSLVHADPAAELPALLLCCDGAVRVRRAGGAERLVPAEALYLGPLTTSLRADELAVEARLRLPAPGTGWGFAEVARRHGDFALVGSVAVLSLDAEGRVARARLGFFGVGGTPVRSRPAEAVLAGQAPRPERLREAARAAAAALRPEGDLHATAEYRRRVAAVLAERTLAAAVRRCREAG